VIPTQHLEPAREVILNKPIIKVNTDAGYLPMFISTTTNVIDSQKVMVINTTDGTPTAVMGKNSQLNPDSVRLSTLGHFSRMKPIIPSLLF